MAALPTVSIQTTDGLATEGVAGDGLAFLLARNGDLSGALTVDIGISSGDVPNNAAPGSDFVPPPDTVTFQPGSATATLALAIIDDTLVEASREGLSVNILQGTGYQLGFGGTSSAYAVIQDNDSDPRPLPRVGIVTTDGTAREGVAGDVISFTLTRGGDLSQPLTINVSVGGDVHPAAPADSGRDFVPAPKTVTFQPGSDTEVLNISVIDDDIVEPTERIVAIIDSGSGYERGSPIGGVANAPGFAAYASIVDDDSSKPTPPRVSIILKTGAATEGVSGGRLSFTLLRTGDISKALTINMYTKPITTGGAAAIAGLDYVDVPSTVTFEPGIGLIDLNIDVIDDALSELTESFIVGIAEGSGYVVSQPSPENQYNPNTYTVSINDNDIVIPSDAFIVGSPNNDRLLAGNGNDKVFAGEDDDIIFGELGSDTLFGEQGSDFIGAGDGNDFVSGGDGDDILSGESGFDLVFGDAGNDQIFAGDGDDTAAGGSGDDTILGGAGNDILLGEDGNDLIRAGDGNDFVSGGAGDDVLFGEFGADFMFGDTGNDRMTLGLGDDNALGGAGNDTLFGEDGNDLINGEEGDDFIGAGAGNDQLSGGAGNDALYGEGGEDVLFGNAGDDVLVGGAGRDRFAFGRGDGHDVVRDFVTGGSEADVIAFNGGAFVNFAAVQAALQQDGADAVIGYGSGDEVRLQNVQTSSLSAANFTFA